MHFINYYEVLQVSPKADIEVIRAAYKRLAVKFHPDTGGDTASAEMMRLLNEAHEILTNPIKRAAYDKASGFDRYVASTETGVPRKTLHKLQLRSDFTAASSHWLDADTNEYCSFRRNGYYHIGVKKAPWERYHTPKIMVKNFEIIVDTQLTKWGNQSQCGLVFRLNQEADRRSFYRFALSSRGYYSLFANMNGKYETLMDYRFSSDILRNGSTNKVALKMQDQRIEIKVNDKPLTFLDDSKIPDSGYVGLLVSRSANDPYVEACFQNFLLFEI